MRQALSIIFVVLILSTCGCAVFAYRSKKPIGKSVALLLASLIPPVIGNLFIIASDKEMLSNVGCYIYFIGMDLVMIALAKFTIDYCGHSKHKKLILLVFGSLLIMDTIQILLNPLTHHVFSMIKLENIYGSDYWKFSPLIGQNLHRILDYFILGMVVINIIVKTLKTEYIAYGEELGQIELSRRFNKGCNGSIVFGVPAAASDFRSAGL